jgi:NAD+ kinase
LAKIVFKSAGIVARYDKKEALKLAEEIADRLEAEGLRVHLEATLGGKTAKKKALMPLKDMNVDFLVVIGGDGTILRTCLTIPKPEPPILAVNMGVRGFLSEVEPKTALNAVDKCLCGDFRIEKCMKLRTTADGVKFPDALNEVVVLADEPTKVLYTQILRGKEAILKCQADGLMISTPTGSTGYSFSAGGPVLDGDLTAFVLTPMCAMSLFRPIVFPADLKVTVQVEVPREMVVVIDGRHRQLLRSEFPSLTVTRSKHITSFIRFGENFYSRLRSRLLFKGTQ